MLIKLNYSSRIKKLQEKCQEHNYDAFVVTSDANLYYFTGKSFFPFERPFILVIWADKDPQFMVPKLELDHMKEIEHIDNICTYYEYPALEGEGWKETLGELLNSCNNLATELYTRSEILRVMDNICHVDVLDWVYTMRYVKTDSEIAMLRETAKYANEGMDYFLSNIRYGSTVIESLKTSKRSFKKAILDYKLNLDYFATDFGCAAWPAPISAQPHSLPHLLDEYNEGPHVIIISYRLNGYAIENERTFFTSEPTEKMKMYFSHMMKAREIAFSMCKPGVLSADIDKAVKQYLLDNGFEKNVIHRTGHGLGVTNHEGPFIAEGSDTVLEKGMVFSIEPGIYFEGLGAFRHSDTVLITEHSYELLTTTPDDLNSLIVKNNSKLNIAALQNWYLKKKCK